MSYLARDYIVEEPEHARLVASCPCGLSQDLMRMLIYGIDSDVNLDVSGKRLRVHYCILEARCKPLIRLWKGHGTPISLPSYSYEVVHFALCHIYAGIVKIPRSIDIRQLLRFTIEFKVEFLKPPIMALIEDKYFHKFHEPCRDCSDAFFEYYPICTASRLKDYVKKFLIWGGMYFDIIWSKIEFAAMPVALSNACFLQVFRTLEDGNVKTIVDIATRCGFTMTPLGGGECDPRVKEMCQRLLGLAVKLTAPQLRAVLRHIESLPADLPQPGRLALDEMLAKAIDVAPPEEACRVYQYLATTDSTDISTTVNSINETHDEIDTSNDSNDQFQSRSSELLRRVEVALIRVASEVMLTPTFKNLPPELGKKLCGILQEPQVVPDCASSASSRPTASTSGCPHASNTNEAWHPGAVSPAEPAYADEAQSGNLIFANATLQRYMRGKLHLELTTGTSLGSQTKKDRPEPYKRLPTKTRPFTRSQKTDANLKARELDENSD